MSAPDRYAVIGNPIAHSKSPQIHAMFAEQTGQLMCYDRRLAEIDRFATEVAAFVREGGKGLNVTVPFKEDAWRLVDAASERAQRAQAVNTLIVKPDGSLTGDNTDGVGLVRDLTVNHGRRLAAGRVLLLGAGGAARGVLGPLLQQLPKQILVANRTAAKARDLAEAFAPDGPVRGCGLTEIGGRFDLIVNATAASLAGQVPPLPDDCLAEGACCYDMMYGAEPTAFMHWGAARGAAQCLDGLGMLVEQAAESFFLWRGLMPETAPVIAALRQRS